MSLSNTFNALSDKTRLEILELLRKKDMSVGEIMINFNITMPSLSHHLSVLKKADLVSSQRQGQQIIYSINLSVFEEVAKDIYKFFKVKNK